MKKYKHKNLIIAKNLRRNLTPWELKLWLNCLKHMPYKFYKQRPIGNYILDFYCAKAKLAIELDGSQHYYAQNKKYDCERTCFLEKQGIKVLRFDNIDVDKNIDGIYQIIIAEINQRLKTLQST